MNRQIPWLRVWVEGVVIVGSILLAFGIDAWWDGRQQRAEGARVLEAILSEARSNVDWLDRMVPYHEARLAAAIVLLDASVQAPITIRTDSVDALLYTLTGTYTPPLERGALDAALLGGKLNLIADEALRSQLASWERRLRNADAEAARGLDFDLSVWVPFLREHASLPQISNAGSEISPGLDLGDRFDSFGLSPVRQAFNHAVLLRNQEFVNILQQKRWVHEDALYNYSTGIKPALDALLEALIAEIRRP